MLPLVLVIRSQLVDMLQFRVPTSTLILLLQWRLFIESVTSSLFIESVTSVSLRRFHL